MNRKGSDLLDVFRSAPRRPSGGGGGGGGGGGDGRSLTLHGRQMAVIAAGGVLLVVLAFVAGIGIGRGGKKSASPDTPLASVRASAWRLPGAALPRIGPGADDLLQRVKSAFETEWPTLVGHYRVEDVPAIAGKASRFRLTVVGLPSREEAEKWQAYLIGWFVAGQVPFEHARPEPEK